jgi:hypothetical protein
MAQVIELALNIKNNNAVDLSKPEWDLLAQNVTFSGIREVHHFRYFGSACEVHGWLKASKSLPEGSGRQKRYDFKWAIGTPKISRTKSFQT